jgi:hypothetical protein
MSSADSLLRKMKQSKYGWRYNDIVSLYRGFGFQQREGGNHTVFFHPVHRHLIATVARHRSLAVGYIQKAITLIDTLQELESAKEQAKKEKQP